MIKHPLFNILIVFSAILLSTPSVSAQGRVYKAPPSTSTSINVPYISDEAMERCVKLYNEAEWLQDKINVTQVDRYSSESVNSYNSNVNRHTQMIERFNRDCAGKQSESAYKAARKLNGG